MIEVEGLSKRYGATAAVDSLSFQAPQGFVTGFLGPNGSGKSTTIRMIMGLDVPSAGRALVDGRPYQELELPLRSVGALIDGRAYHPGRSAKAHLVALAKANRIPPSRVGQVLDQVGLTKVANRRAGTFSLGMGQRLGIAAALLGDPGTLILDEPVNGLDPEGIRWVRDLVRSLAAEGKSILISSHLIAEMALTADRVVVIGSGRMLAEISMSDLAEAGSRGVKVRSSEPERMLDLLVGAGAQVNASDDGALLVTGIEPEDLSRLAGDQRVPLYELTPLETSLEDIFLQLTNESVEYRAGAKTPAMA